MPEIRVKRDLNNKILNLTSLSIIEDLVWNGYKAVYAGGCVRDMLMGYNPNDFDIATSATPKQIREIFPTTKFVGESFGVSLLTIEGETFEVATFREDGPYSDGRRPDSIKLTTSMERDAKRRDFTINALFYDPTTMEVIDFVGGIEDINNKVLRTVQDPRISFSADYLRIIRGIRFYIKYDLSLDPHTESGIKYFSSCLNQLPEERLQDEFNKMLSIGKPRKMMEILLSTKVISYFFKSVSLFPGCLQDPIHHPEGDVLEHTIRVMEDLVKQGFSDYRHQLAGLLHDIGKPFTYAIIDGRLTHREHEHIGAGVAELEMRNLKYSNEDIEFVTYMVENHMKFLSIMEMRKSKLMKFLSHPYINDLIFLCIADNNGCGNPQKIQYIEFAKKKIEEFSEEENKINLPLPLITGKDLVDVGYKPGPLFKEILKFVYDLQLDDLISSKNEAMLYVKENWKIKEVL